MDRPLTRNSFRVQFLKSLLYLISFDGIISRVGTSVASALRDRCPLDQSKRGFHRPVFRYSGKFIPVAQYLRFNRRISFPSCFRTWFSATGPATC